MHDSGNDFRNEPPTFAADSPMEDNNNFFGCVSVISLLIFSGLCGMIVALLGF